MNYGDNFTERALSLLEPDLIAVSYKHNISGYDPEDIQQELRIKLWQALKTYKSNGAGLRTWGVRVINNRLIDLLRQSQYLNHRALTKSRPLDDDFMDTYLSAEDILKYLEDFC
jgi:RNA polymerase sigma factor (sigma-70 family)